MIRYKIVRTPWSEAYGDLVAKIDSNGERLETFNPARNHPEYVEWLAAGNTPEPPDPLPEPVDPGPSLADRIEAAETLINLILSEGE